MLNFPLMPRSAIANEGTIARTKKRNEAKISIVHPSLGTLTINQWPTINKENNEILYWI